MRLCIQAIINWSFEMSKTKHFIASSCDSLNFLSYSKFTFSMISHSKFISNKHHHQYHQQQHQINSPIGFFFVRKSKHNSQWDTLQTHRFFSTHFVSLIVLEFQEKVFAEMGSHMFRWTKVVCESKGREPLTSTNQQQYKLKSANCKNLSLFGTFLFKP